MLVFKDIFNNKTSPRLSQQELDKYFTKLAPQRKAIVEELLNNQLKFIVSFPSQENIGIKLGISRKHVWNTTELLQEVGICKKINRGFKKTCIYIFEHELFKFNLRQILVKHFPSLKWIPLTLLIALQNKQMVKEVTLKERVIFNNNIITTYSNRPAPEFLNNYIKKGRDMENSKPTAYEEAKNLLKLTQVGMAKLLLFEEEALSYAIDQYKMKLRIKHRFYPTPFVFLFNTAQDYSKSNNLKLDWIKFYEWKEKLNWDKATANTEYEKQRGFAKPYVNKFIDKNIKLNNNHSPMINSGAPQNVLIKTQCPIMDVTQQITVKTTQEQLKELENKITELQKGIDNLNNLIAGANYNMITIYKSVIEIHKKEISYVMKEIDQITALVPILQTA